MNKIKEYRQEYKQDQFFRKNKNLLLKYKMYSCNIHLTPISVKSIIVF